MADNKKDFHITNNNNKTNHITNINHYNLPKKEETKFDKYRKTKSTIKSEGRDAFNIMKVIFLLIFAVCFARILIGYQDTNLTFATFLKTLNTLPDFNIRDILDWNILQLLPETFVPPQWLINIANVLDKFFNPLEFFIICGFNSIIFSYNVIKLLLLL